ncbi:hypothetical protein, partial [Vibrio sagamiensis]|uniref:hypothetical protein n=1 Tax=Vibrio sagamiensis TaxID=512650 RepID=UPI000587959E
MNGTLIGDLQLVPGSVQTPNGFAVTETSNSFSIMANDYNPYATQQEMISIGAISVSGVSGDGWV